MNGTARVFLDCRLGSLHAVRVRCRVDANGIEVKLMDDVTVVERVTQTGDGSAWAWVTLAAGGLVVTEDTRMFLLVVASQPLRVERIVIASG